MIVKADATIFSAGNLKNWKSGENQIIFYCENNTALKVQVLSDSVIRFRYSMTDGFPADFSYAVDPDYKPLKPTDFLIMPLEGKVLVKTGLLELTILKESLKVEIRDHEGNLINQDSSGFEWTNTEDENRKKFWIKKKSLPEEMYFGLGDKVFDQNLRGKKYINYNFDSFKYSIKADPLYRTIPFYMGLHNEKAYGIFFDNTWKSFFDFDSLYYGDVQWGADGGEMNYYFIYGQP